MELWGQYSRKTPKHPKTSLWIDPSILGKLISLNFKWVFEITNSRLKRPNEGLMATTASASLNFRIGGEREDMLKLESKADWLKSFTGVEVKAPTLLYSLF